MGNQSSSTVSHDTSAATKSHYELLGISQTATQEEITKAYRKKALELHPDRNHGKEEEATLLFAEVGAAYSVLSDPQERAWYDSHEAEFVSGATSGEDGEVKFHGGMKVTTAEDIRAMMASRNRAMNDFTDSSNGFYTNIRELFERLAMEESIAAANSSYEPVDYPSFGSSQDEFQDVVKKFYTTWQRFSTTKSFAWKDLYRAGPEYDRRTRRVIEKENQKARDEAIREFNDAVRGLVLFIRRRDPRYVATETTDAERQATLLKAAADQAARARKANAAKLAGNAIPDWARSRGDQEGDDDATDDEEGDGDVEEESEEDEPEIWECELCSKTFKSEGQFDAHERSKKHKQAVAKVKREMRHQDKELGLDDEQDEVEIEGDKDDAATHDTEQPMGEVEQELNEKLDLSDEQAPKDISVSEKSSAITASSSSDEDEAEDDSYAPRSDIESRLINKNTSTISSGTSTPVTNLDSELESKPTLGTSTPKLGKAKEKRAKRQAQAAAKAEAAKNDEDAALTCVACDSAFASKNKLFDHIKRTGHARPTAASAASSRKKKR